MLPLANVGGDPAQEYFADGITEALITELAKIRSMRVVSRTSVTRFRGTKEPVSADRPRPARASAAGGQLLGAPFSAEYWHIGETNIRLATVSPRIEMGENRTLILSNPSIGSAQPCHLRPLRRVSQDFEHAVDNADGTAMTGSDSNDPIEPRVL